MEMISGSVDMKDAIGPTTIGTGVSLATVSPAFILQCVGVIIALLGIIYTRLRVKESRRANDLAEKRLLWEQEIHASSKDLQDQEKATADSLQTCQEKEEKEVG